MKKKIGFIGLGIMGRPMAKNLIDAGFPLSVYDLIPASIQELVDSGASEAKSLKDIAENSDVIITMLPNSPQVYDVLVGTDGVLDVLKKGTFWIDMTTGAPKAAREINKLLSERGVTFFDAPVSGGQVGAINGTLSIMVGGEKEKLDDIMNILKAMGTNINYLGAIGSGQAAKMCNQIICAMNIHAICEAFALGEAEGLDLKVLRGVIGGGAANSWMLENLGEKIIAKDNSAGFKIDLQVKDLKIAIDSAFEKKVPVPGTMLSTSMYMEAQAHGEGNNGNQSLFSVYDRLASMESRS